MLLEIGRIQKSTDDCLSKTIFFQKMFKQNKNLLNKKNLIYRI